MRKVTKILFLSVLSLFMVVSLASCGDSTEPTKPTNDVTEPEPTVEKTPTVEETPQVTKYTVTFDSNGGSTVSSVQVESGEKITKPADPVKEGHTFNGWYYIDDNNENQEC